MSAPKSVTRLVEQFEERKPANETEVRRQFVDPLFNALGWDLTDNRQVGLEVRVMVAEGGISRPKRPDYGFRIGGATHFFVETKPPHVNLKQDSLPAYQLRRYGWSGNKPVSVLTDFEEFSVYDCRIQPQPKDSAATARLSYYQYREYIDKWDELEARFSREAVAQGALRDWIEGERVRGAESVDQAFLREMENWRESLAKHIALQNSGLRQRELNLLVQRAIDRIVFLRIAEDRDIEAYGRLRSAAADGKQVYEELKILFNEADDKYNSGLFHFGAKRLARQPARPALAHDRHPRRAPAPDHQQPLLPAQPLRILGAARRYPRPSLRALPGQGHRLQPQRRRQHPGKARSAQSRRRLLHAHLYRPITSCKTPSAPCWRGRRPKPRPGCASSTPLAAAAPSSAAPINSCSTGISIITAGSATNTATASARLPRASSSRPAEKRRILQNNIYGVDLDENAVEVSKLSLLLKMLERESEATGAQTLMFSAGGRILPDLSDNIKWGNSLIGSDFYRGAQGALVRG